MIGIRKNIRVKSTYAKFDLIFYGILSIIKIITGNGEEFV